MHISSTLNAPRILANVPFTTKSTYSTLISAQFKMGPVQIRTFAWNNYRFTNFTLL